MRANAFLEIELVLREENENRALAQHGTINYLKTFELHRFIGFLEKIKRYNNQFTTQTYHPNADGKTKVFSSEFHKNHLDALLKPSTWIALGQINPRVDEKIQVLGSHWLPRISRSLASSETLVQILENKELEELAAEANAAWREIRWKKMTDPRNRAIYEQIIFYLRPFVNLTHLKAEKNRVINDLLGRLHVASHSENSTIDDVVHYVVTRLKDLKVANQLLGEKQTTKFLKSPHYCNMNESLYARIIHQIETHGSKQQVSALRKFPVFNEDTKMFPTRNLLRKNHIFTVPVSLIDDIPQFKPWPSWLFPNRYFRYQYFRKKQWFLQIIKTGGHDQPESEHVQAKIRWASTVASRESEKVAQEIRETPSKRSKAFLEKWRACILEFSEFAQSTSLRILANEDTTCNTENLNFPVESSMKMGVSSINVKSYTASSKQKKILDHFYRVSNGQDISNLNLKLVANLLKQARLALLAPEDSFSRECSRYINGNLFAGTGAYLINASSLNWMSGDPEQRRLFVTSLMDYFSLSNHVSVKEQGINFIHPFSQILINQLKIICQNIVHNANGNQLSLEKISESHAHLRELILIGEKSSHLQIFSLKLCRELMLIHNPHLLEVKSRAILEGIAAKRISPHPRLWIKPQAEIPNTPTALPKLSKGGRR